MPDNEPFGIDTKPEHANLIDQAMQLMGDEASASSLRVLTRLLDSSKDILLIKRGNGLVLVADMPTRSDFDSDPEGTEPYGTYILSRIPGSHILRYKANNGNRFVEQQPSEAIVDIVMSAFGS